MAYAGPVSGSVRCRRLRFVALQSVDGAGDECLLARTHGTSACEGAESDSATQFRSVAASPVATGRSAEWEDNARWATTIATAAATTASASDDKRDGRHGWEERGSYAMISGCWGSGRGGGRNES